MVGGGARAGVFMSLSVSIVFIILFTFHISVRRFFVFMSSVQEIMRFDSNTSEESFMSGKSNTIFPVAGTH